MNFVIFHLTLVTDLFTDSGIWLINSSYCSCQVFSVRGESYIDSHGQCIIMTLVSGGAITNYVLKFRKVIEFESSCFVVYFFYIYPIIDGKRWKSGRVLLLPIFTGELIEPFNLPEALAPDKYKGKDKEN